MSESRKELGTELKRLRKEARLTQAKLAKAIGVDESYISKIEANKLSYTPSEETLRLLARELETDTLKLLSLAKKAPKELQEAAKSEDAREFFSLLQENSIESDDWQNLTTTLRHRLSGRKGKR
jgi:transcriptional regulator with XRE-family HTH domain